MNKLAMGHGFKALHDFFNVVFLHKIFLSLVKEAFKSVPRILSAQCVGPQ